MSGETGVLGQLATSRAGRDAGARYLVIGLSGPSQVLVADGARRGVGRPKRKNLKHLRLEGTVAPLAEKIRAGQAVTDKDVREALAGAEVVRE